MPATNLITVRISGVIVARLYPRHPVPCVAAAFQGKRTRYADGQQLDRSAMLCPMDSPNCFDICYEILTTHEPGPVRDAWVQWLDAVIEWNIGGGVGPVPRTPQTITG